MDGSCYVIDLDANKETYIPYSSVFKNLQTIILETNNESLIGTITELQVFNGLIFVLDAHIAKGLFVFNTDGKFLNKIGGIGGGPGEYSRIYDFTIDTDNQCVFLLVQGSRVHKYEFDGTYMSSINIQLQNTNSYFIQYYNGRLYSSIIAWEPQKDDCMLVEINPENGKILSQTLPIKFNKGWAKGGFTGNRFFMSRLNSPPRYTQMFMDYIVSIDERISPYIELKSKYLFTNKELENLPDGLSIREILRHFQGVTKIWDVNSFIENDDFIIFRCGSGIDLSDYFSVIFNKKTEEVKLAKKLKNDLILRRVDDEKSVMSVMSGRFIFSDINGAYEMIPPMIFAQFKNSIRNNEIVSDLDKLDQIMQLNDDSNPIIFYYEYK